MVASPLVLTGVWMLAWCTPQGTASKAFSDTPVPPMGGNLMRVGINRNLVGKIDQSSVAAHKAGAYKWTHGWTREDMTMAQLANEIHAGYGFGPWFSDGHNGGHRRNANFHSTQVAAVDIDNKGGQRCWTLEELKQFQFVTDYGGMIYTTPSHTPEKPRFRVVFELESPITDPDRAKALNKYLTKLFESDPAASAISQGFHGSPGCEFHLLNRVLPDALVEQFLTAQQRTVRRTSKKQHQNPDERTAHHADLKLRNDTPMRRTGEQQFVPLYTLSNGCSVHCPDPAHDDQNASASVLTSKEDGIRGVWCHAHQKMYWLEGRRIRHAESHGRDELFSELVELANREDAKVHVFESTFDWRHPTEKFLNWIPACQGILLIRSPKGTGKTEAISRLLAPDTRPFRDYVAERNRWYLEEFGIEPRLDGGDQIKHECRIEAYTSPSESHILMIGHRVLLIRELAKRLSLTLYDDNGRAVSPTPRFAVTLDSLHNRLRMDLPWRKYHTVVIDEVEQVVNHLLADTMKDNRESAISALLWVIRHAKRLIFSDADLGPMTRLLLKQAGRWHGDDSIYYFHNEPRGFLPTGANSSAQRLQSGSPKVSVYESEQDLEEEMIARYKAGARIFVCSNWKSKATHIASMLRDLDGSEHRAPILLVTADTNGTRDVTDFMSSPREKILDYSAVVSSPTLGSGIDITLDNADSDGKGTDIAVYGFFMHGTNSYTDIDQHLARVRSPKSVSVWVSSAPSYEECRVHKIKEDIIFKDQAFFFLQKIDDDGYEHLELGDPTLNFIAEIISYRRRAMRFLHASFVQYKRNTGCVVVGVPKTDTPHEELERLRKIANEKLVASKVNRILTSRKLDPEDAYNLKSASRSEKISQESRAALERHLLEDFYRTEISESLIKLNKDWKHSKKVRNFELLIASEESVRSWDHNDLDKHAIDRKNLMLKRTALHALLTALGLDCLKVCEYPEGWEISQPSLAAFRDMYRGMQLEVLSTLELRHRSDLKGSTVNTVRAVLNCIGLDIQLARRKSCEDGQREKIYELDRDSFSEMVELVKRRKEIPSKQFYPETSLYGSIKVERSKRILPRAKKTPQEIIRDLKSSRSKPSNATTGHTDASRQGE